MVGGRRRREFFSCLYRVGMLCCLAILVKKGSVRRFSTRPTARVHKPILLVYVLLAYGIFQNFLPSCMSVVQHFCGATLGRDIGQAIDSCPG